MNPAARRAHLRLAGLLLPAVAGLAAGCGGARPAQPVKTAPQPGPTYINAAARSGLGAFEHSDGSCGRHYFPEQMGGGVALFDFDGDGWLDVFFTNGRPLPGYQGAPLRNALFRNKHDGTFEDVTEKAGLSGGAHYCVGAAAADFDNDGHVDLFVTAMGPDLLYRNRGDGTFEDVTAKAGVGDPRLGASAAWGDYDGDGYLDLYVANYVKYQLDKDLYCASKTPGKRTYCGPGIYQPERHSLFRNNRNGTFTDVTAAALGSPVGNGLGVLWTDYDDDGRPDLFVANDLWPNFLYRNLGNGKFREVAKDLGVAYGEDGDRRAGMGVDSGDYDNDGRLDLMVTNFSEEPNALYHNEGAVFRDLGIASGMGSATFRYLGFGTGFLDYDLDGRQDLFFANGHVLDDIAVLSDAVTWKQSSQLFRNTGGGRFEETSVPSGIAGGQRVARGAAFGDLENRGRTDIVVSAIRDRATHYRHEGTTAGHWIELELRAAKGNPQAVGAKVWLKSGGVTQQREVRAGSSYASSSDPRLLFGLGASGTIEELRIRWPNGAITTHPGLAVDQIHQVLQSGGAVAMK
ncbi:MAG: UnbV [Armatimonadetes bacterium]|nr:UnbV [Armatimonadota bacterium]